MNAVIAARRSTPLPHVQPMTYRASCRFCQANDQVIAALPVRPDRLVTTCRQAQCTVCGGLLIEGDDVWIAELQEANALYAHDEDADEKPMAWSAQDSCSDVAR